MGLIKVYIQIDSAGTWLTLPTSRDAFQKAMSEIGVTESTDIIIGQYTTEMAALSNELLKSTDLDHANYLAARLASMNCEQTEKLSAIMESSFRFSTIALLIDYTYNTDFFLFRAGINDAAALGRYYVFDTGLCQMPEEWKGGIDLERFGSHAAKQENGAFTSKGYLMPSGDKWQNHMAEYGVPDKYRLYLQGE